MKKNLVILTMLMLALSLFAIGCGDDSDDGGNNDDNNGDNGEQTGDTFAAIKNDFNNPEFDFQPPWTICKMHYNGATWDGPLTHGEVTEEKAVSPGLDYVLMIGAWDNEDCDPDYLMPFASKNEEEIVEGQTRTININVPNHQGSCPPEGVAPIPEAQYNRILELWPDYNFKPYEEKDQNPACSH